MKDISYSYCRARIPSLQLAQLHQRGLLKQDVLVDTPARLCMSAEYEAHAPEIEHLDQSVSLPVPSLSLNASYTPTTRRMHCWHDLQAASYLTPISEVDDSESLVPSRLASPMLSLRRSASHLSVSSNGHGSKVPSIASATSSKSHTYDDALRRLKGQHSTDALLSFSDPADRLQFPALQSFSSYADDNEDDPRAEEDEAFADAEKSSARLTTSAFVRSVSLQVAKATESETTNSSPSVDGLRQDKACDIDSESDEPKWKQITRLLLCIPMSAAKQPSSA